MLGVIPEEIGDLEELIELDLRLNKIEGNGTDIFSLLFYKYVYVRNITKVYFKVEEITRIIFIRQFHWWLVLFLFSLQFITHTTTVLGEIPEEIADFPDLMGLYLFNNNFTSKLLFNEVPSLLFMYWKL